MAGAEWRQSATVAAACFLIFCILAIKNDQPHASSLEQKAAKPRDFLTGKEAREEMKEYWQQEGREPALAHPGKLVDYLTAKEARQKLNDFWKEEDAAESKFLRAHKPPSSSLANAAASSMEKMERLWSSEKPLVKPLPSRRLDEAHGARRSQLPLCEHCSLQHLRWPAWNHRVDHAMRVASKIAAGSQWNATLHGDSSEEAAGEEKKIDDAITTLKTALQKEKEEAPSAAGMKTASAPQVQCLSVCYAEAQSLLARVRGKSQGKGKEEKTVKPVRAPAGNSTSTSDSSAAEDAEEVEDLALAAAAKAQEEVKKGEESLKAVLERIAKSQSAATSR